MAESVPLNLGHDRERAVAWHPGGGLELADRGEALETHRRSCRLSRPPIAP